ncbi:P-loop containing nucleoside triphosphate hydrolase protein [Dichomitus squalens]|uniref:RNA helicase n=1 Tax=Dichomitus squalens TaxID=114155 RepID=A0A4Q9MNW3_9APHY|nr:P-loop containing nucleoside triphosphate hydrolase protein [Dichomitus squalens]
MSQVLFSYCPQTLYGEGCTDPDCTLIHDAKYCKLCAVICEPALAYESHCTTDAHIKQQNRPRWLHCPICNVSLPTPGSWSSHANGRAHQRCAVKRGLNPSLVKPVEPPSNSPQLRYCETCELTVAFDAWTVHRGGKSHRLREQHALFRASIGRATQDRGVSVSHEDGLDFGIVSLAVAKAGVNAEVVITTSTTSPVYEVLASIHSGIAGKLRSKKIQSPFATALDCNDVPPCYSLSLPIRFTALNRGRYEEHLAITFRAVNGASFVILRRLRVTVGDAADHESLKPVTPYIRNRRVQWRKDLPTVSGERPSSFLAAQYIRKLPEARIPVELGDILKSGTPQEVETRIREKYFSEPLSLAIHASQFANLLWIEEDRMVEDLRRYDMSDVIFTKEGRLHSLRVPGLAEKRPSVMIGDAINVQAANGADERTYKGFVHDVYMETVRVSFHESFKAEGRRYNVSFQLNRIPLRRQHQALDASAPDPQRLLFPLPGQQGLGRALGQDEQPVTFFNPLIAANPAQTLAVKSILQLRPGAAPFVVFGPPGTGKTVTDVEAILQILDRDKDAKILACAPSNSAADIIALRLSATFTTAEMFRANAPSRDPRSVPEALELYTLHLTYRYGFPPLEDLKKFRVIVSTCGNASFAYNVGIERGHFSYIFVDEAGQATEPEVLTAVKTMSSKDTRIVLSGDPKQLGPIIRSSIAREQGLGVSYMERLLERPVYDAQTGRGLSWVKLLQNYRSHEAILHYPNEKFYDNELQVCGAHGTVNSFLGSSQLASPEFPVVFHALAGHNDRESTSPSYFNIDEASEVKAYVQALLADRQYPIQAKDIGVITPYHAQVRKIRKLLRDADIPDVDVGSVEIFQGQERRAIILSTVRSSADLLAYDAKFTLGFVSNPRRFNVAITRAQALLIVIGDPGILCLDPIWRGFLNYVYLHGGWRGDPPTWDVNVPVRDDADYFDELQEALAAEMGVFMSRLPSEGEDLEGDANVEREFQETE